MTSSAETASAETRANCRHAWTEPGPQRLIFTIDAWQGVTDALIQCPRCSQYAYINVLSWCGRNLCYRVFSVSHMNECAVDVFLRNMNSDYCDLSRRGAEVNALVNGRTPTRDVFVALVPELEVIDARRVNEIPQLADWRESKQDSGPWFAAFDFRP